MSTTARKFVNYNNFDTKASYQPGDRVPYGMGYVTTPGGVEVEDLNGRIVVDLDRDCFEEPPTDDDLREYVKECLHGEPFSASYVVGRGRHAYDDSCEIRITGFKIVEVREKEVVIEAEEFEYV